MEGDLGLEKALEFYQKDIILKTKNNQAFKKALILFKKNHNFAQAFYKKKLISITDFVLLKVCIDKNYVLNQVFLFLVKRLRQQQKIKAKIVTLMIYPLILLLELLVILSLSVFWVGPAMDQFFKNLRITSPFFVQALVWFNQKAQLFFSVDFLPWLIIILSGIWLIYQLIHFEACKHFFSQILIRLHFVGYLYKLIVLQQAFSALQIMLIGKKSKEIDQELKILAYIIPSFSYKKVFLALGNHLEKGGLIRQFFDHQRNQKFFPIVIQRLLILAERKKTWCLEIKSILNFLNQEADNQLKRLFALLEPAMVLLIAFLVAVLALNLQEVISQMQKTIIIGS